MIKLNLGRNCLKLIIRTYGIKEIFVPYYSCDTIWQAVREENCRLKFYHINEDFMPVQDFNKNDYILYINYFGLFDDNLEKLVKKYPNIIIDNTHSFYSKPLGLASFNSLRKFFPVQNGAFLYMKKEIKENILLDKTELKVADIQSNYELFKQNELFLNSEPIKFLSENVENALNNIDFDEDKNARTILYNKYSKIFGKYNLIKLPKLKNNIPYCYPFCTNNVSLIDKIEQNDIKIIKLWGNLAKSFPEYKFLNNVGALPLNDAFIAEKIIQSVGLAVKD